MQNVNGDTPHQLYALACENAGNLTKMADIVVKHDGHQSIQSTYRRLSYAYTKKSDEVSCNL